MEEVTKNHTQLRSITNSDFSFQNKYSFYYAYFEKGIKVFEKIKAMDLFIIKLF